MRSKSHLASQKSFEKRKSRLQGLEGLEGASNAQVDAKAVRILRATQAATGLTEARSCLGCRPSDHYQRAVIHVEIDNLSTISSR